MSKTCWPLPCASFCLKTYDGLLISLQQVFIQSISSLFSMVLVFGLILSFYLTIIMVSTPKSSSSQVFDFELYFVLSIIFTMLLVAWQIFLGINEGITNFDFYNFTNTFNNPGELQFVIVVSLIFLGLLPGLYLKPTITSLVNLVNNKESLTTNNTNTRNYRVGFLGMFAIVLAMAISANQGIWDATQGVRLSGGWVIQKVYISNLNINNFSQSQNWAGHDIIGPMGLVSENEKAYFLIRWKNNNQKYFQRNPGLYILPRDELIIIPVNDPSLTIAVTPTTPTGVPQPTSTATNTPKPTKSLEPTITPTISQP